MPSVWPTIRHWPVSLPHRPQGGAGRACILSYPPLLSGAPRTPRSRSPRAFLNGMPQKGPSHLSSNSGGKARLSASYTSENLPTPRRRRYCLRLHVVTAPIRCPSRCDAVGRHAGPSGGSPGRRCPMVGSNPTHPINAAFLASHAPGTADTRGTAAKVAAFTAKARLLRHLLDQQEASLGARDAYFARQPRPAYRRCTPGWPGSLTDAPVNSLRSSAVRWRLPRVVLAELLIRIKAAELGDIASEVTVAVVAA